MSGGIDSSVAAALLRRQGHDLVGVYLHFWSDPMPTGSQKPSPTNKCCHAASLIAARQVADQLGIPFYSYNVKAPFKKAVVDYFLAAYRRGLTPNPCVVCNQKIKFGVVGDLMKKLNCRHIASGHYAKVKKVGDKFTIHTGKDKIKDQSYFLYQLNQDQLSRLILPLGDYRKSETKSLARRLGLDMVQEKPESQGICFIPEREPADFLKRYLPKESFRRGNIITTDGQRVGRHKGLLLYTIGQRRGIEIGGLKDPYYVQALDIKKNQLLVGTDKQLYQKEITVGDLSFVSGKPPQGKAKVSVRIRHRHWPAAAWLTVDKDKAQVVFVRAQRAPAPGQHAVFYQGDKVLGGGAILP